MRGIFLLILVATTISGCVSEEAAGTPYKQLTQEEPPSIAASAKNSEEVSLLVSYLSGIHAFYAAALPPDRRPPNEILKDLHALPKEKLLGLRAYVLKAPYLTGKAMDLMHELLPEGHREYLFQALETKGWGPFAVGALADLNDPKLVGPILDRVNTERAEGLERLYRPSNPAFLEAIRRKHAAQPTIRTAYVLGVYGILAEKDIRECLASPDKNIRNFALSGLTISRDKNALPLLLQLADLSKESEWPLVANRFISEGAVHVDELIHWLDLSPEKEKVALYALARIHSDIGVARALARYPNKPFDNSFASESTHSSPKAATEFITERAVSGSQQQKLNALLLAHHLTSWYPVTPGKEHPVFETILEASHDSDPEIRYDALRLINQYAYDAQYPEGLNGLRRVAEMLRDPSPRVRGEATIQASQYPSPEVLTLLKKMADDEKEDPKVRENAARSAASLEKDLSRLAGSGRKQVHLNGG